ncbi:MAG: peptide-methionine (S)-S-oxide reductase MsrA [Halobacteriales archaeon]|nr:peptide-methionine (S)-S-oxide reductase MsrA [Halobacteriales archaeon]
MEEATFAGGCFWCVEAPFKRIDGVESVTSGYIGGDTEDPTYEEVCSGTTGHTEAVRIVYDPEVVSYRELLEVLFAIHNPTTLNRQGPDVGSQYRSAVFYHDKAQRDEVKEYIKKLEDEGVYDGIVTEISSANEYEFYEAEEYHQDYYEKNPDQPYCATRIPPKLEKVEEKFPELLN